MKRRWMFWRVPFLAAVAIICAAGIVVRAPQALPAGVYATPTPKPTPTPVLATPTPEPTPVPGAIAILEDSKLICTMLSQEDADELLSWKLFEAEKAIPAGEELQVAVYEHAVTQRAARVGEMPIELAQAQALLQADRTLLQARVITRQTDMEIIPFETEEKEDKRIPHGSRIVQQVGRTGQHTILTTRTYLNGRLEGEPVVEESTIAPVAESILVGTYVAETPDGTPGRSEGQRGRAGPEGFPLSLPIEGAITSNFGTRERVMHYGIDIECKVGDSILAPGDGLVVFVGERSSYGRVVEIAHGDGFVSRLTPLQNISVQVGQGVQRGQPVGQLAPPVDEEKEPHMHFELLIDGLPYNPRQYLA